MLPYAARAAIRKDVDVSRRKYVFAPRSLVASYRVIEEIYLVGGNWQDQIREVRKKKLSNKELQTTK